MIAFHHDKDIDMLRLGCTLPNLANICLHKSLYAKFYPFTEGDDRGEDLLEKFDKMLVVHLSFLHEKQLLMKRLFESLQTYENLLLGSMPANYTPTRCANPCPPVFIRVGTSIQKPVDSHLDKARPAALQIWSCPISNEQDQNVKLKASLQRQGEENWLLQCWWVLFSLPHCVWSHGLLLPLLSLSRAASLSLKRVFNVVARRESSMHWDDTIYKRKAARLLKGGSANGGDCTK